VVVETVPAGGRGTGGVERTARATPDGYTIAVGDQTQFRDSGLAIRSLRRVKDLEAV